MAEARTRAIPISSVTIGARHRKDLGDLRGLAASIGDIGLLHPIVVTPDSVLIAGERRLRAAELLGWTEIPATVIDLEEIIRGECAENTARKDFSPSEAVAIAETLRPLEEARARERMVAAHASPGKFPELEDGRARDRVAEHVGLSGRTLEKAVAVVESGKPELVDLMDSTGSVDRAFKEMKKAEVAEQRKAAPLPAGKYRVIYADPPWKYATEQHSKTEQETVLASHYPSMSTPAICALPIYDMALDDSVLFLWATCPKMPEALQVLFSWGFTYKAQFIWDKIKHNVGHYNSVRHELLLVATRGSCLPDSKRLYDSVVSIERTEHSVKPPYFRELIDAMYPSMGADRIELFCRGDIPSYWAKWGTGE